MEKFKINDKINCLTSFCDNMKGIVIFCHGFGESKEKIKEHSKILNDNNIGIIGFDFPCHGQDSTKFQDFTYNLGINYIDETLKYTEKKYPNIPISIMGTSFGGYMTLCYINDKNYSFHKVFLKNPAVNFYECTKRKLHIDDSYFDSNNYFEISSRYKLYKEFYYDSKKHDIMIKFNKHNNDIYIIHGNQDKTVLIEDVLKFVKKNNIHLNIVDGATHGMDKYIDIINDELINFIG